MYLEGFLHKTPMLIIPFCPTQSPPSDFAKTHKLTFHPQIDSPKAITTPR
jgi:hypothetical protein